MSRRTKLLIASTFLVLLAIPGIYLACTWSTHNPLRFEVTRVEIENFWPIADGTVNLTVRNTSNLPVYLDPPSMVTPTSGGLAQAYLTHMSVKMPDGSRRPFYSTVYVPPGGSIACTHRFMVEMEVRDARKYLESIEVNYRWRSGTVEKVNELRQWLVSKGPGNFHLIVPLPKDSHDSARLELPAPVSP